MAKALILSPNYPLFMKKKKGKNEDLLLGNGKKCGSVDDYGRERQGNLWKSHISWI